MWCCTRYKHRRTMESFLSVCDYFKFASNDSDKISNFLRNRILNLKRLMLIKALHSRKNTPHVALKYRIEKNQILLIKKKINKVEFLIAPAKLFYFSLTICATCGLALSYWEPLKRPLLMTSNLFSWARYIKAFTVVFS